MLTPARDVIGDLFPDLALEPTASPQVLRRCNAVEEIRRKRTEGTQELSFGARPFILCGLPIRRLPTGAQTYTRRNGKFFLEIIGHPDHGVPFGQDRLVLLWLATVAVRQQNPVVRFESAADILNEWGLPNNGSHYRRLAEAFGRVFGSTMFFGTKDQRRGSEVWDCSRVHFLDHMRLWSHDEGATNSRDGNSVRLSDVFWGELKAHPIPVDTEVIRMVANNPGCLDLYTWLTWRCHQACGAGRVPLFGPLGLMNQLGVQDYARERKFRERINGWLKLIRLYWPECPATLAKGGSYLVVDRALAITTRLQTRL
jgi:hypothetical protein